MNKFWQWVKNEAGAERTLHLNGPIAEETWWGDEVTPKAFKDDLLAGSGPVTVWINSPGGDVFAGSQIYNMLREYGLNYPVTVKIDGIAASAASVIAMAGGRVCMSPVSCMFIHNPATFAVGDSAEMVRVKQMLDAVKDAIINAYELKSGQSRVTISHMMDDETMMDARKAVELKFADEMLYSAPPAAEPEPVTNRGFMFSQAAVMNSLAARMQKDKTARPAPAGTPISALDKRLALIKN